MPALSQYLAYFIACVYVAGDDHGRFHFGGRYLLGILQDDLPIPAIHTTCQEYDVGICLFQLPDFPVIQSPVKHVDHFGPGAKSRPVGGFRGQPGNEAHGNHAQTTGSAGGG